MMPKMSEPPKLDYAPPRRQPVRRATWRDYLVWGAMGFLWSAAAALVVMLLLFLLNHL
jgi:hypothetical protein